MKITKVSKGTSPDRVVVTTDSGEKLRMSRLIAAEHGVYEGAEIVDEAALRAAVAQWATRDRAVRIVAAADVSVKALRRRLRRKGESEQAADDAAKWLSDLGLVDDKRAGEGVVRSGLAKGYGERRIRQMLFEKEIPREYWEELLSDLPPMDETVDRLLSQKLKSDDPKDVRRAVDALLRCGHTLEDIRAGLRRRQTELEDLQ